MFRNLPHLPRHTSPSVTHLIVTYLIFHDIRHLPQCTSSSPELPYVLSYMGFSDFCHLMLLDSPPLVYLTFPDRSHVTDLFHASDLFMLPDRSHVSVLFHASDLITIPDRSHVSDLFMPRIYSRYLIDLMSLICFMPQIYSCCLVDLMSQICFMYQMYSRCLVDIMALVYLLPAVYLMPQIYSGCPDLLLVL